MMEKFSVHYNCKHCSWNQIDRATCDKCGQAMLPVNGEPASSRIIDASRRVDGEIFVVRKSINYIATYQAQCIDGNQITANLALNDVPEGASPGSVIEIITEQAYADIARSGMNATSVLVLNLSRVW